MRACILPGLDGTGSLLHEFAHALAPDLQAQVIAYPTAGAGDYDALTACAAAQVADHAPCLLIAESFSGPIGIRLAAQSPRQFAGLVLCASFARTPSGMLPRPLARVASRLPMDALPMGLVTTMMLGRWSTPAWRDRTRAAISAVDPHTLRWRLQAALDIDVRDTLARIRVPVLYLQASADRVVSAASARLVCSTLPHTQMQVVEGPHFLLQAQPQRCATLITRWLAQDSRAAR